MIKALQRFVELETSAGIVLVLATVLAMVFANTPLHQAYETLRHFELGLPLLEWVNDGLMAIFFLLVGLEIRREVLNGELNTIRKALLPAIAALGGMVVPAAIYVAFNYEGQALRGWGIPVATDIAFSLGILSLLGRRVPVSLKAFLTALAIFDDLGAIIIIAAFYGNHFSFLFLGLAAACFGILVLLRLTKVTNIWWYLLPGLALWYCLHHSGLHATLAGVFLAFLVPNPDQIETKLHPWVAYGILPIFAFLNAGVAFSLQDGADLLHPVALGVAVGLVVGKQIGVFGATALAIKLRLAPLPTHASWLGVYGTACICGVGFTMSLFIGALAFEVGGSYEQFVKLGVIGGSIISAIWGYLVLRLLPISRGPY